MKYSYVIHTPEENIAFDADVFGTNGDIFTKGNYTLNISVSKKRGYKVFEVSVFANKEAEVYLSLYGEGEAELYSFNGVCDKERIFRQSPHDYHNYQFKMEKSAIPMVAAVTGENADIFISDNPSFFDNATTQHIIPEQGKFFLTSGDNGETTNCEETDEFFPIFHQIDEATPHTFRFIAFSANAATLKKIRREAYKAIEAVWGEGNPSPYRAVCFAGNYMHIRKNEKGTSEKWVVPGIQYANCQYTRDAFYQSMILGADMDEQCYRSLLKYEMLEAENPLIYLIWSYRLVKNGKSFDKASADVAFKEIIKCMDKHDDGGFYPNCREHGDFRNWFDICAYEFDDVDAYTQGLCICALECARRLGYDIGDRKKRAMVRYRSLFNGHYIPMSQKKQFLALDVSVGEVIYYLLFDAVFVPHEMFRKTYRKIFDGPSRTPHGIKIVSAPDGSYLPVEAYGLNGYIHPGFATLDTGRYANGGSYHVYEMLFHIAAYIHGVEDAEQNLINRLMIDLDYDGATHEYMHTVKGHGVKANQGWNASIYAIWSEIIKKGKATDAFFKAADAKMDSME